MQVRQAIQSAQRSSCQGTEIQIVIPNDDDESSYPKDLRKYVKTVQMMVDDLCWVTKLARLQLEALRSAIGRKVVLVELDQYFIRPLDPVFDEHFNWDVGLTYRQNNRFGPINSGIMFFRVSEVVVEFYDHYVQETIHLSQRYYSKPPTNGCKSGANQMVLSKFYNDKDLAFWDSFMYQFRLSRSSANFANITIMSVPCPTYNRQVSQCRDLHVDPADGVAVYHFVGTGAKKHLLNCKNEFRVAKEMVQKTHLHDCKNEIPAPRR